jgi:hypothetical protein
MGNKIEKYSFKLNIFLDGLQLNPKFSLNVAKGKNVLPNATPKVFSSIPQMH